MSIFFLTNELANYADFNINRFTVNTYAIQVYKMMKNLNILIFSLIIIIAGSLVAEDYKVGPGDILEINFWQEPTLNSQIRVSQEGKISLDIAGEIEVTGKTTSQLETDIVRRISRLNKNISQAVVRVSEYNYQYVFVSGQVRQPGKYAFEEIPGLWKVINEAGGTNEIGDLSRVTIIRGGERAGEVEVVNVANAIAAGDLSRLPKIYREDTIEIPRNPAGLLSAELGQNREQKNVIYVVGAVTNPGPISFEDNIDVLEAISLAGGIQDNANWKKTKIISKDGYYGQSMQINLEKYSNTGAAARYTMRKEDVIVVPSKSGFFGVAGFNLTTIGAIAGVITSSILIYDQVSNNDNSSQGR